jgi:purine nucleosidase
MFIQFERPLSYLHDPLAVAVAADPTLVDAPEEQVAIEARGQFTGGTTMIQRRGRPGGFVTKVAKTVDAERFGRYFTQTLGLA